MPDLRQQLRQFYEEKSLPEEKAAEILARGREAAMEGPQTEEPSSAPPAPKAPIQFPRRYALGIGIAAALAIAGFLWLQMRPSQVPFAALPPRIIEFFGGTYEIPEVSQDHAQLRAWSLRQGAPEAFQIPPKMRSLESYGCAVVPVQGKPSYLTCFWTDATKPEADRGGADLVHLFVTRRSDFSGTPTSPEPQYSERDGWSFATWAEGDVGYTVATMNPVTTLRKFVAEWRDDGVRIASR